MKQTFLASFVPDDTGDRVKRMVIYSGEPVYRYDWMADLEYYLSLSLTENSIRMDRIIGGPLLKDHNRSVDNVIGVIEKAYVSDGALYGETRFSDTPDVDPIWQKVSSGILRQVSVEAVLHSTRDVTKRGDKYRNIISEDWEPEAVAIVPVGADSGARLFSACPRPEQVGMIRHLRTSVGSKGSPALTAKPGVEIARAILGLRLRTMGQ
jgi:hypothetical protein